MILNKTTVVGLFDNDKDVEKAVTALQKEGFGKDDNKIRIVDEHRLAQETPIDVPQKSFVQPGETIAEPATAGTIANKTAVSEQSARESLMKLGLDQEEAEFHARHVTRGSSLVVIEADEARAPEAEKIMAQANARISVE